MAFKTKAELYSKIHICPKEHKTVELVWTENRGLCHTCNRKYKMTQLKVKVA